MESPSTSSIPNDTTKMSQKITSRRKKSRPVKYMQDYILTESSEELLPSSSDGLPESHSPFSQSNQNQLTDGHHFPANNNAAPVEVQESHALMLADPSANEMSDMIQRRVTSIRESSLLKASSCKRVKLDEATSPEPQPVKVQEAETTFSSLLHNFASQVNSRVEVCERKSPFKERSPLPDALWPSKSNQEILPDRECSGTHGDIHRQSENHTVRGGRQEMSFSGLLQNFVSCVNDTSTQGSSAHHPKLMSMLTSGHKHSSENTDVNDANSTMTNFTSRGETQQSFAGLLHDFASVVDKGVHMNNSVLHRQQQRKSSISLLDILHEKISKEVLEASPSHQQTFPSENQCNQTFDDVESPHLTSSEVTEDKNSPNTGVESTKANVVVKSELVDDLHPNYHQWSHIQNVLPPIDDSEEDAAQQRKQQSVSSSFSAPLAPIKQEILEEIHEELHDAADTSTSNHAQCLSECTADSEKMHFPQSQCMRVIKQEFTDDYEKRELNTSILSQNINDNSRDRLNTCIDARESPLSSVDETQNSHDFQTADSQKAKHAGNEVGNRQSNQAGLVSHLLNTGDSSHWKAKNKGSFADFLHDITSSVLDKSVVGNEGQESFSGLLTIKQEPRVSDEDPQSSSYLKCHPSGDQSGSSSTSESISTQLDSKDVSSSPKKRVPLCVSRIMTDTLQSTCDKSQGSGIRHQKLKEISYAESSPSTSSEDAESKIEHPSNLAKTKVKALHCLSPHSKRSSLMKHRWKLGSHVKFGQKIKQAWVKRRDDLHRRTEVSNQHTMEPQGRSDVQASVSGTERLSSESDRMSFTDILQKLAKKCQGSGEDSFVRLKYPGQQHSQGPLGSASPQLEPLLCDKKQMGAAHGMPSTQSNPSSANLRNLLLQESSLGQLHLAKVSTSETPSTSVQSHNVSFANLMQDMATTVTKKKGISSITQTAYEDLTSVTPPSPWIKSMSENWLRFLILSPDENPKVTISVSVNLWNKIHEVKIHCHHMEVPVNHWIFRRFGKRIHTKAALQGVLQAICNGCSVCEGTTRSDLVQMYRNKLASTSRWQAAALLEDSFGSAAIRSSQCELLVSGLRRSREKRCSKCSKFVDRKLKAVMYHLRKKLGLS
ncbi:uncharacterized protein [Diadema antillarum]|uniref:uncharacterized protein n=1 Tax=Diadema antillarum TaxID=105358 RepID=UPI003A8681D8